MRRLFIVLGFLGVIALVIIAWTNLWLASYEMATYEDIAQKRYRLAQTADTIHIAIIWPDEALWNGANLAAQEINDRGGLAVNIQGHQGKKTKTLVKITLHRYSVPISEELALARKIARDAKFAAVIGHNGPLVADFASVSYHYTKLLFFGVNVIGLVLTNHDFAYVFRNVPNEIEFAQVIAQTLSRPDLFRGNRVGVLFVRSVRTLTFLDKIREGLERFKLNVVFQLAYDTNLAPGDYIKYTGLLQRVSPRGHSVSTHAPGQSLRNSIASGRDLLFDSIVLLDDNPKNAREAIGHLRSLGINTPVVGGVRLDADDLFPEGQRPVERLLPEAEPAGDQSPPSAPADIPEQGQLIYIASVFSRDFPELQDLVKRFEARYPGRRLDFIASQGYEAVQILAQAFQRADSIAPVDVVAALKLHGPYKGLLENVSFRLNGDIQGKKIIVKVLESTPSQR